MNVVETGIASESCVNCRSFMTKTVRPPCHHFVCAECVQIQGHVFPRLACKGFYVCYECGEKVILPPSYFLILQSGDRQPLPQLFQERITQGWSKQGLDRYPVLQPHPASSSTKAGLQGSQPLPTDIHAPLFYNPSVYPQPHFASWTGSFEKPKEFFLPPRPPASGLQPQTNTIIFHTTCSVKSSTPSRPGSLEPRKTVFDHRLEEKPRESSLDPSHFVRREPVARDAVFGRPASDIPESQVLQSSASFGVPASSHPPPRDSDLSFARPVQQLRTHPAASKPVLIEAQAQTDPPTTAKTEAASFTIAQVAPQAKKQALPAHAAFASQTEVDWQTPASQLQLTVDNRLNQIIIIPPFRKSQPDFAPMVAPISLSPIDPKSRDFDRIFPIPQEMHKYVYNPVTSDRDSVTKRHLRSQHKAPVREREVFASMHHTQQDQDFDEDDTSRAELPRRSPPRLHPAKDFPSKTNLKAPRPADHRDCPLPPNRRQATEDRVDQLHAISGVHSGAEDASLLQRDSREEPEHYESELQTKPNHNKSKKGHARQDSSLQNNPISPDPELTEFKQAAKKARDLEQENLLRTMLEKEIERYREREEKDREARIHKEQEDRARELKEKERRENELLEREKLDRDRREKDDCERRERLEAERKELDRKEKDWQDKLEAWRKEEVERNRQLALERAAREDKEKAIQQEMAKLELIKLELLKSQEEAERKRKETEEADRKQRETAIAQEREQKEREWLEKLESAKQEILKREEEQLAQIKQQWQAQQQKESEKRQQELQLKEQQLAEEMGKLEETRKELQRIKEEIQEKSRLETEEKERLQRERESRELQAKSTTIAISPACLKQKTVSIELKLDSPQESVPDRGLDSFPLKRAGQSRFPKGKNQKKSPADSEEPLDRPVTADPIVPVEYPDYETNEYLRSMIKQVPLTRISASEGNLLVDKRLRAAGQPEDLSSHRPLNQKDFEYERTAQLSAHLLQPAESPEIHELHQEAEEMRWRLKREIHIEKERKRLQGKEELIRQQLEQADKQELATRPKRIRNPPPREESHESQRASVRLPKTDVQEFRSTILDKLLQRQAPVHSRERDSSSRPDCSRPADASKPPQDQQADQPQPRSSNLIRDAFYRTKSIVRSELEKNPSLAVPRFSDEPEIDSLALEKARSFGKTDFFQSLKTTANTNLSAGLTEAHLKKCTKSGRLQSSYRSIDSRSHRPTEPQPQPTHCCHSFLIKPASGLGLKKKSSALVSLESGSVFRGLLKEARCEELH